MDELHRLKEEIKQLKVENEQLKTQFRNFFASGSTVDVPEPFEAIFNEAQETVQKYFIELRANPEKAKIAVDDKRYILVRGSSLSLEFFNKVMDLYSDRGEEQAWIIARNLLFDIAHVLGASDADNFRKSMSLENPIGRLSAGPVHFAFTGWAYVKIHPDSNPQPNKDFYLHYEHLHSFEAEAWIKEGRKPPFPVCVMNAGYSSGWCEDSFGIPLTAVEVSCRARGDEACRFIMAPPDEIHRYLEQENSDQEETMDVPLFFERKRSEERLKSTLEEKDMLLKELHHRVKNNLQIISSLISLSEHHKKYDTASLLADLKERVSAIGLIHEKLYRSDDVSNVDLAEYLAGLAKGVHSGLCDQRAIQLELDLPENLGKLNIDRAISCGLLINECLSNSCKYAFPKDQGKVSLNARRIEDRIYIEVVDDGKGFDQNSSSNKGMGLDLIHSLADQLDASLRIIGVDGTRVMLNFPT